MIIFPGGVQQKWNFWRGGGVHFVSRFWKFQRGLGVIGKIPSVRGYGYFLELHNGPSKYKCWKLFQATLMHGFLDLFCLIVTKQPTRPVILFFAWFYGSNSKSCNMVRQLMTIESVSTYPTYLIIEKSKLFPIETLGPI